MIHGDILTLSMTFYPPKAEIKEKITRMQSPSDFSLRLLSCESYFLAEFWKTYLEKVLVLGEAFLIL